MNKMNSFSDEIIQIIIHYLDYKTILILHQVSKRFAFQSRDNLLWKNLFSIEFPHSYPLSSTPSLQSIIWKIKFKLFYKWQIGQFQHFQIPSSSSIYFYNSIQKRLYTIMNQKLLEYDLRTRKSIELKELHAFEPILIFNYKEFLWIGYINGRIDCLNHKKCIKSMNLNVSIHLIRMDSQHIVFLTSDFVVHVYQWSLVEPSNNQLNESDESDVVDQINLKRMHKLKSTVCSLPMDVKLTQSTISILYQMGFYDGTYCPGLQVLEFTQTCIRSIQHSYSFEPVHGTMSTLQFAMNGWILVGFEDNFIHLYSIDGEKIILCLCGGVCSVAWDEYGKLVIGTNQGLFVKQFPLHPPQTYKIQQSQKQSQEQGEDYVHLMDSKWMESWTKESYSPTHISFDDEYILFVDMKRFGIQIYDFT